MNGPSKTYTTLLPLGVLVLSVLVAFQFFQSQLQSGHKLQVLEFQSSAARRGLFLKNRLERKLNSLISISSLFRASTHVSPEEFKVFTENVVKDKSFYQICWRDSTLGDLYSAFPDRQEICNQVDPLDELELLQQDTKNNFIVSSVYTQSRFGTQKGRLTVLLSVDGNLFDRQVFSDSFHFEKIFVTNSSSHTAFSIDLHGELLEDQKLPAEVGGSPDDQLVYTNLAAIGPARFTYISHFQRAKVVSRKNLNLVLATLLIFLGGLGIAFYIRMLLVRQGLAQQNVLRKDEQLVETRAGLQALTQRNALALQASQIGVWEWDLVSNQLSWDAQMFSLYGTSEGQFSGAYEAWEKGLHPDDRERSTQEIQEAIKQGQKFNTEFRVVWPSGEVRHVRALADVIMEGEVPVKMIGANWDITSEKATQENLKTVNRNLERANEELLQFSYRSSHDLKGPLITIRGLTQVIAEDIDDKNYTDVKDNLQFIGKQVLSLENLVVDLLELAKADLVVSKAEEIDFKVLCDEVLGLNQGLSRKKQVRVETDLKIQHDWQLPKTRIVQVLNNLVSNGIKYSDSKKKDKFVKIVLRDTVDTLNIEVLDNGVGIQMKDKAEVFEMFKRFHDGKVAGSGVGAYIIKKHIDILNGDIDFETSPEGTHFKIQLARERI